MSDGLPSVRTSPSVAMATVVQAGAVVSAVCLSAALLHNVILFLFIDSSLLTAFTISDHIATAVEMLPFAIVLGLFVLARIPFKPDTVREAQRWLWGLPLAGLVVWIVAGVIGWPNNAGLWFALALPMGWAIGGDYLLQQKMANASGSARLLARFAGIVIAMVVYSAVYRGVMLAIPIATHSLTMADKSQLQGHLVQILDRGVVVISVPERTVLFLAKDEVKRIEKLRR